MNDSGLRFDESVPVTTIEVKDAAVEAIPESERVAVGEKVVCKLAQERASYRVLRYVLPVVKRRDTGELVSARAPANVLERTAADVSLLAGMLVDKFRHHLPLHRQHRRMADAGIVVSRSSLTNWAGRAADLLAPVAAAQTAHVLESRVLAMDETPIKAGLKEPGRMRQGYFWPIHGEDDEIVFPYAPTREHKHVEAFLGEFRGTLVSDGYEAYARYAAKRAGVRHAQCWAYVAVVVMLRRARIDARGAGSAARRRNITSFDHSAPRNAMSPLFVFHGRPGPGSEASHSATALAFVSRSISA